MIKALIMDDNVYDIIIRDRKKLGLDLYDEVWEGVYTLPSMPTLAHQNLVSDLSAIFHRLVVARRRGWVQPGANVSDRRTDWRDNYRVPDVIVVLRNGRAVDCDTHWYGGPDFLVEIESPGDDTEQKIPFYSKIKVQELLIIHRDSRKLRLFRHDGTELAAIAPTAFHGGKWLVSEVLPLAFRRKPARGKAKTELQRTDGKPGRWTV